MIRRLSSGFRRDFFFSLFSGWIFVFFVL